MKRLGEVITIQRGETWSLDFEVTNAKGDPYMLFKQWKNPFLAITVTSVRYEQVGDFRKTWWLDLDKRWVEKIDGTFELIPVKRFTGTEAMYTQFHDIGQILTIYPRITATGNKSQDYDITNFLFFTDSNIDNNNVYKYVSNYEVDIHGNITEQTWEEYNFRIIKQFKTNDWVEQNYLLDMKVITGETIAEHVRGILLEQDEQFIPQLPWSDAQTREQIERITDKKLFQYMQDCQNSGMPLMPDYDTKNLVLEPTKLMVSANVQGGIR